MILRHLVAFASIIAAVLTLIVAGLTTYFLMGRYAVPVSAEYELSNLLIPWIAMLGLPNLLFDRTPSTLQDQSRLVSIALCGQIAVLLILAGGGIYLCIAQLESGQKWETLNLSRTWSTAALPIGYSFSAVILFSRLLSGLKQKR